MATIIIKTILVNIVITINIRSGRYNTSVMNLVATHHNCISPWDYISHHALHTHIPVHHYTAVTIHSLVLIASPHLHLILTLTFKQHSHMHSLRSLVSPWLHFRAFFPVCLSVHYLDCWPPLLIVCCLPLWPRLFYGNPLCLPPALTHCSASDFDSAFSTLPSIPLLDICLFDLVQLKLLVDLLSPLTCHLLQHLSIFFPQ